MAKRQRIWGWPDGLAWQAALATGRRLRRQRHERMLRCLRPGETTQMVDIGVTSTQAGAYNSLERNWPWPANLTAVGIEGCPEVCSQRGIEFVQADGCDLPFATSQFDLAVSNAVIEHVGSRDRQRTFLAELCRVAEAGWISTPDAASPLEPHTLIPMAHWLPRRLREGVYRLAGRGYFADEANLNPLNEQQFRNLFPAGLRGAVRIWRQYLFGLPVVLTAWFDARTPMPEGLAVRRFVSADLPAVRDLHIRALVAQGVPYISGPWEADLDDIPGVYLQAGGEFLVGTDTQGEIVAMGALRRCDARTVEITRMRIDEACQRRGYGRAILRRLEAIARRLGYRTAVLLTSTYQTPAQRFYESEGYRRTHTSTSGQFTLLHYRKDLTTTT